MAVDPGNPDVLYLCVCANSCGSGGVSTGIYKSTDGGSAWKNMHGFGAPNHIRVDPTNSNNLYVSDGVCGGTNGFFTSTDEGATWARPGGFDSVTAILPTSRDAYICSPDPADFKHILITSHQCCNSEIIESFDGGKHCILHPSIQGVGAGGGFNVFFLSNPALGIGDSRTWIFMTQDGGPGWYHTTNSGASWTQVTAHPMMHGGN